MFAASLDKRFARGARGLTLIEVLVASTIGLIVIAGATILFRFVGNRIDFISAEQRNALESSAVIEIVTKQVHLGTIVTVESPQQIVIDTNGAAWYRFKLIPNSDNTHDTLTYENPISSGTYSKVITPYACTFVNATFSANGGAGVTFNFTVRSSLDSTFFTPVGMSALCKNHTSF